jgi:hypothetical protein
METELKKKYANITRQTIDLFLSLCMQCQLKKKIPKRGLVVRPILSNFMNSRCQVDLVDMQSEPDGDFRFIMNYQDHLTKFTMLRPIRTKTAEEVAYQVLDIFCIFGAPLILQSDNGREFANRVVENLKEMWPGLRLVHGKPRHSQSQGSVERSNQDIRDMLVAWLSDNKQSTWSEGLRFIQSKKNRALHVGIKTSPYEAMFGSAQRVGLADSALTADMYDSINTEEELEALLAAHNDDSDVTECEEEPHEVTVNDVLCIICEKTVANPVECSSCNRCIHVQCGEYADEVLICTLCKRKNNINSQREGAKKGLQEQAERMLKLSNAKLPPIAVGQNVVVRVPDVDRGRLAPRSILAVVIDVNASGMYRLGTKEGNIDRLYARNEITAADSDFITFADVPATSISLRSASVISSGSQQGFVHCTCQRYCIDKKCKCKKSGVLCNSKCHNNSACKNK